MDPRRRAAVALALFGVSGLSSIFFLLLPKSWKENHAECHSLPFPWLRILRSVAKSFKWSGGSQAHFLFCYLSSLRSQHGCFQKIGFFPPKWMVYFMVPAL